MRTARQEAVHRQSYWSECIGSQAAAEKGVAGHRRLRVVEHGAEWAGSD